MKDNQILVVHEQVKAPKMITYYKLPNTFQVIHTVTRRKSSGLTLIAIVVVGLATGVLKKLWLGSSLLRYWLPVDVVLLLVLVLGIIHVGGVPRFP